MGIAFSPLISFEYLLLMNFIYWSLYERVMFVYSFSYFKKYRLQQSHNLQNSMLAPNIPPLRDFDLPLSPLLTTQSIPTRYSTTLSSISGSTISMPEVIIMIPKFLVKLFIVFLQLFGFWLIIWWSIKQSIMATSYTHMSFECISPITTTYMWAFWHTKI